MPSLARPVVRAALAAALLLGLAASCGGVSPGASAASGPRAPDFTLPALDGSTVRLSQYRGQSVVLLDFWSTTCDPCMVEMPHLVELYEKHKADGFVVLAVSIDGPESRAQVASVAHDKGMTFPVLLDEETSVVARFNPKKEMPYAVLVDRDGVVRHKRAGYQPGDEKLLAAEVDKALAR